MNFPTKILVPTDFSALAQNAFEYALFLANAVKSSVEVLHIYGDVVGIPTSDAVSFEVLKNRQQNAQKELDIFVKNKQKLPPQIIENVLVSQRVEAGLLMEIVAEATQKKEYGLVVIGTHSTHNWVESLLGSVSSSLVNHSNSPVVVVPEQYTFAPIVNIGFATDLHEYNLAGVLEAVALAKQFGAALHCIHVSTDEDSRHTDLLDLDSFLQLHAQDITYQIFDIEADSVSEGIDRCIQEEKLDLLLMVRPPRNFFQKIFHHSQTKEQILQPKIPIWIFKPY